MCVEGVVRCPYKCGDKRNILNYRRISILSAILKLFEKLVCKTPIIRPSISDEQHGFVGGRSTVTGLVKFANFVLSEMKDGVQVEVVYTDTFRRLSIERIMGCYWAR
jgi:hypothetical protein